MIPAALALALLAATPTPAKWPLPPVVYQARTRDCDVRLRIAPELAAVPTAYAAIKAKALADLQAFEAAAGPDMARTRRQMPGSVMARAPEVARIEVDFVTRTPHLIGFIRRDYLDAHGAHSAYVISGLLYEVPSGRRLAATDLIRPETIGAVNAVLTGAVKAAKAKRGEPVTSDDGFVKPGDITWAGGSALMARHDLFVSGDRTTDAPVLATLMASSAPDHASGLQFLYSPYDIGAFAEGAYRVVLPWKTFAADLKPRYRQDFAGAPVGDLAPDPLAAFPEDVPPAPR